MILNDGKLRIALYLAASGNSYDKIIDWGSGGRGYSHCEIVFPDGWSFSSTTRDESVVPLPNDALHRSVEKKDGTRWKKIDFDPTHWRFHVLPDLDTSRLIAMEKYANSILDARYDWWGAARVSALGGWWFREHTDKYFCSEAVLEVCHAGECFNSVASLISPNRFSKKLNLEKI